MTLEPKYEEGTQDLIDTLDSQFKNLTRTQLADKAVEIATRQIMSCNDFKKPRIERIAKYWSLYDGKTQKKLRQLFNVAIPVFPGMIDTLNAQYDTPIEMTFKEGDASDYFKVEKVNAAFRIEVMNTAQNSKWDSKLSMGRKLGIMEGRTILEFTAESDPEYYSELENVRLKNFTFQPQGGLYLENHLFSGRQDIEKTQYDLIRGAQNGVYERNQVKELLATIAKSDYLPGQSTDIAAKLDRFKPLGLDPENNNYVGQTVHNLASQILEIGGKRWYVLFDVWTKKWLRFEPWNEICSSELYPWVTYATHEDEDNFLSKSYGDDLYAASDAIVAMFNQELTNREKRNFGARAYDKDMFPDVRKLDEAMHRPDALVPADTKGGTRRISEGVYEFKVGDLGGTVNLIDWVTSSLGRNTGANDMAMGSVEDVSKKASVAFAEQKSVSKRIGWASRPFQNMMAELGKRYVYGLKDHMPSSMAIRLLGEKGWDWDEITRLDLNMTKDVDVLIESRDEQVRQSEMRKEKRKEALLAVAKSPNINTRKLDESILKDIGEYEDQDVAEFLDVQTYQDKKSLAKASVAIQAIKAGKEPEQWYGATVAFMQKIVDFANDNRAKYPAEYEKLISYALSHKDIVKTNIERKISEQSLAPQPPVAGPTSSVPGPSPASSSIPSGVSRAMNVAEAASA